MTRSAQSSSFPRTDGGGSGALLGDGFLADSVLEEWKRTGIAGVSGTILTLSDGRRFTMTDGLRILGRRNGDSDPYGLTGRILSLRSILRRGGLLSPDGVRLGAAIYDVGFGVITELVLDSAPALAADPDLVPSAVRTRSSVPPNARS